MFNRGSDDPDAIREPVAAQLASWTALGASFWMSVETWVELGRLAGFGSSAAALPAAVDALTVGALVTWTAPVDPAVQAFARKTTYTMAGLSLLAQSSYHGWRAAADSGDPWRIGLAIGVGLLPPLAAALAVHFRALVRQGLIRRRDARHASAAASARQARAELDLATREALAAASRASANMEAARRDAGELTERLASVRQEAASLTESLAASTSDAVALAAARVGDLVAELELAEDRARQALQPPATRQRATRQPKPPAVASPGGSPGDYVTRYPDVARRLAAGDAQDVIAKEEGVGARTVQRVAAALAKAGAEVVAAASAATGEGQK